MQINTYDVLIIGGGIAGIALALRLAPELRIGLLSKDALIHSASYYAQGGIAAVLDDSDTLENHYQDTLNAGAGLCDAKIVQQVVSEASDCLHWLLDQGVPFAGTAANETGFSWQLAREGGHSHYRIAHVGDATGRFVIAKLTEKLLARRNVEIFTNYTAMDIVKQDEQCCGITAVNAIGKLELFLAKAIALATGGASGIYARTTHPFLTTGDGIAMAARAGCQINNLEFTQFHPTCFYNPNSKPFLISEAVRGQGGYLVLPDGTRFMLSYDERAELATRDIVTRAIEWQRKELGLDCVYLDIRHLDASLALKHFPHIHQHCLQQGIDFTQQLIPVVPAAHYTCGGVVTDAQAKTTLQNLYAVGEVACTGLHGANRLASNSLLEGLVFAKAAAASIHMEVTTITDPIAKNISLREEFYKTVDINLIAEHIKILRQTMWDHVGIIRDEASLLKAKKIINELNNQFKTLPKSLHTAWIQLRNMLMVAELTIEAALARKESVGCHYRCDFETISLVRSA